MSKRKHTQLKAVEDLILAMHQDGMTLREIGDELGLILILTLISYQSPIKMCNAHFNCDTVIGTRRIFAMLTLSSRKCNAGTALKTD